MNGTSSSHACDNMRVAEESSSQQQCTQITWRCAVEGSDTAGLKHTETSRTLNGFKLLRHVWAHGTCRAWKWAPFMYAKRAVV